MDAVKVQADIEYKTTDKGPLTLDIYSPPGMKGSAAPVVVFVLGFSDAGAQRMLGCKFKDMGSYISWARLMAASGLAAITYSTTAPETDLDELLQYLRRNGTALGIDAARIGIWACSGNVPLALSRLIKVGYTPAKCAVLCYGYMLDLDGGTVVAEAAKRWGFVNPCGGKSVSDFPPVLPLFVARAGRDETPHLNQTIDTFVVKALACNLPITLANHPDGPHAFDFEHDSERSREIVRQILMFMQCHLRSE
jgi:hypothetical protein